MHLMVQIDSKGRIHLNETVNIKMDLNPDFGKEFTLCRDACWIGWGQYYNKRIKW